MNKLIGIFKRFFIAQRGNSVSSVKGYVSVIRDFGTFVSKKGINVESATPETVMEYVSVVKKRCKPQTAAGYVTKLKTFYQILVQKGLVKASPVGEIHIKWHQEPRDILSDNEVEGILGQARVNYGSKGSLYANKQGFCKCSKEVRALRDYLILSLLSETGVRIAELLNIKPMDIDFEAKRIRILGKGNKVRIQPITAQTGALMGTFLAQSGSVINRDAPVFDITRPGVDNIIKFFCGLADVSKSISPHSFRHYFITACHRRGLDLISLQRLAGHANLNTTSRYTHISIDDLQEKYESVQGGTC